MPCSACFFDGYRVCPSMKHFFFMTLPCSLTKEKTLWMPVLNFKNQNVFLTANNLWVFLIKFSLYVYLVSVYTSESMPLLDCMLLNVWGFLFFHCLTENSTQLCNKRTQNMMLILVVNTMECINRLRLVYCLCFSKILLPVSFSL